MLIHPGAETDSEEVAVHLNYSVTESVCMRMYNRDGYLINKIYVAWASAYCSRCGFS